MTTSIIITYFNNKQHLINCVASVLKSVGVDLEIILIDDHSTESFADLYPQYQKDWRFTIDTQPNHIGISACRNKGAAQATGDILVFLNTDIRVEPMTLALLITPFATSPTVGMTQAILYKANNTIETAGHFLSYSGFPYNYAPAKLPEKPYTVFGCSGLVAIRKTAFTASGGYDVDHCLSGENTDISWRIAKAGYTAVAAIDAKAHHIQDIPSEQMKERIYYERSKTLFSMILKNAATPFILIWIFTVPLLWIGVAIKLLIGKQGLYALQIFKGLLWNLTHIILTIQKRMCNKNTQSIRHAVLFGPASFGEQAKKGVGDIPNII